MRNPTKTDTFTATTTNFGFITNFCNGLHILIIYFRSRHQFYYLFFLLLSLAGCVTPEENANFETDIISLTSILDSIFQDNGRDSLRSVTKTIQVNEGQAETRHIEDYNIKKDLEMLEEYDIATPRWADYVNTRVQDSADLKVIYYTIDNKRAPVSHIKIVKKSDRILSIDIYSEKKSLVSRQEVNVNWTPDLGYSIHNSSKLLFNKPKIFFMKVDY